MSDTGLNANIYYLTSRYLEFINDFLISIQDETKNVSDEQLKKFKTLIEKLRDENTIDTQIQSLSVIIERELRAKKVSHKKLYSTIDENLSSHKYAALAKNLNHVVDALDNEYTHALAKMKEG